MWTCFCGMQLKIAGIVIGLITTFFYLFWLGTDISILIGPFHADFPVNLVLELVLSIVFLTTSILLIYGAIKEHHSLLLPWLILSAVLVTMILSYTVYNMIEIIFKRTYNAIPRRLFNFHFIFAFLLMIWWYAILSLYHQLRMKTRPHQLTAI